VYAAIIEELGACSTSQCEPFTQRPETLD